MVDSVRNGGANISQSLDRDISRCGECNNEGHNNRGCSSSGKIKRSKQDGDGGDGGVSHGDGGAQGRGRGDGGARGRGFAYWLGA